MTNETATKIIRIRMTMLFLIVCAVVIFFLSVQTVHAKSKVETAISWAIDTAYDSSAGYSLTNRWGPDYDCGSFVTSAFRNAGIKLTGFTNVTSMKSVYTRYGFTWIDWNDLGAVNTKGIPALLKRGDILVDQNRHTEIYLGNGMDVAAHNYYGHPETGDQTGKEISVSSFYNNLSGVSWDGILRYTGTKNTAGSGTSEASASNSSSDKQNNNIVNKVSRISVSNRVYDGTSEKSPVTVYGKNGEVIAASDYSLTYTGDLKNAGSVTVKAKGKNHYSGSAKAVYQIQRKDASNAVISTISKRKYSGRLITPSPGIRVDGKKLKKDTDYKLSAVNTRTKGTLNIRFIGNYKGSAARNFTISKISLSSVKPSLKTKKFVYSGEDIEPELKAGHLTKDVDYTVKYKNNRNAGKATMTLKGKSMVSGSATFRYTISRKPIENVQVADTTYTGEPLMAEISYEDPNTTARTDYDNNVNAGKGTVTIVGYGNYKGKLTEDFNIEPRAISECQIAGVQEQYLYTGEDVSQDLLDIKYNGYDATYRLKYGNRSEIGTKSFQIIGTGNFNGKVKESFQIVPGVAELKSLTPGTAQLKVKYRKMSGGVKYQIAYRKAGEKKWYYSVSSDTSATLTGLQSRKKYTVKVRAYKGTCYGAWSGALSAKTK